MSRNRQIYVLGAPFILALACGGRSRLSGSDGDGSQMGGAGHTSGGEDSFAGSDSGGEPQASGSSSAAGGKASQNEESGGGSGGRSASDGGHAGSDSGGSTGEFCPWGKYDTDLTDKSLTCKVWSVCEPGTYQADFGGFARDTQCLPCASGSFTSEAAASWCRAWSLCGFGEDQQVAPSSTHDRECKIASEFPRHQFDGDVRASGLVLTEKGVYLLASGTRNYVRTEYAVLPYSLLGQPQTPWLLSDPGLQDYQDQLGDIAHSGSDILVAASNYSVNHQQNPDFAPGYIKMFSFDGELIWESRLGANDEDYNSLQVDEHDGKIYVLASVYPNCSLDPTNPNCTLTNYYTTLELRLHVFDATGTELSVKALVANSDAYSLFDMKVASDGHIYVSTAIGSSGLPCVYDFDNAGSLLGKSQRTVNFSSIGGQLATDETGHVYRLTTAGVEGKNIALERFSAGGVAALGATIALESGDSIEAFAREDSGFVMVGRSAAGPALYRLNADGNLVSREVRREVRVPWNFSAVSVASGGQVFVGGSDNLSAFVAPWPN